MKKKFFSFVLAIILIIPCIFSLTACGQSSSGGTSMSKSELATSYKTVAKHSWEQLGAGDPIGDKSSQTVTSKDISLMSFNRKDLPDEMTEQTDDDAVGVKAMSATMIAYVYMVGEYYENENFVVSDKVVTFDMENLILPNEKTSYSVRLSLLPKIDKSKNKVVVEMFLSSDTMYNNIYKQVKAYYYFDVDYNFQTNKMTSFYALCVQNNITVSDNDYEEYIEMSLDKDGKCWGTYEVSNSYKAVCNQTLANFETEISNGEFITGNFCDEFNRYSERANTAYANVYNSNL